MHGQSVFGEFELYYIRDKQKREVYFLITNKGKPFALIEVKSRTRELSFSLVHFNKILKLNFCIQVVGFNVPRYSFLKTKKKFGRVLVE